MLAGAVPIAQSAADAASTSTQGLTMNIIQTIIGKFRKTDPETSKEAAKTVTTNAETIVLEAIKAFPEGCIADDIVELTQMRWDTVTPRFAPLLRKKLIEDTGERRKGASGRSQRVLKAI